MKIKKQSKNAVSIFGLGRLGLPIALCFAYRNYRTIGVDVDTEKIKRINSRISPIYEPRVQEFLEKTENQFAATENYNFAIKNSNVSFIIVPTPSKENGEFSLEYILPVCQKIGELLKKKLDFHTVVISSTVMPGDTDFIRELLETNSGKKCGKDFGFCYNPEFIRLGSVTQDFLDPDFILIGEFNKFSGDILTRMYRDICKNNPSIVRMNLINAELTKIALNSYITMKISFANTLAEICEKLPEGNVDSVTSALGLDSRIGSKYLKGGLGSGGPCFPRDNIAFSRMANQIGAQSLLAKITDKVNQHQIHRIVDLIKLKLPENGRVGILGLTYKPGTDVTEKSQGLEIAQRLANKGISVTAFDPSKLINLEKILQKNIYFAMSLESCVKDSNLIIISTPWNEFKKIEPELLRNKLVIDCWRILKPEQYKDCKEYIAIGVNNKNRGKINVQLEK